MIIPGTGGQESVLRTMAKYHYFCLAGHHLQSTFKGLNICNLILDPNAAERACKKMLHGPYILLDDIEDGTFVPELPAIRALTTTLVTCKLLTTPHQIDSHDLIYDGDPRCLNVQLANP